MIECDPYYGIICLCAVRYALGRQTYIPSLVQNYVTDHIKEIDTQSIKTMYKDVAESPYYGDEEIDKPGWMEFLKFLDNEIYTRESEAQ